MSMILVTGASGFIGRHLVCKMGEWDWRGLVVSRRPFTHYPKWEWAGREDVLTGRAFEHVQIRTIIHLEVKQHVQNPTSLELREFEETNVMGTSQWLDWASRKGVKRIIYFSSIKAVEGSASVLDESANVAPGTPYGQSKWKAEQVIRDWTESDKERSSLILRPAVVYGSGNVANIYSLVDAIYRGNFFLVGSNDNVKSIVSIQNLCCAVIHLMVRMKPGTETYNITDEHSYSVKDLAAMIARHLGVPWEGRSIPVPFARAGAFLGTALSSLIDRDLPLTKQRLAALLETTNFSCAKLLSTGFNHPQSTQDGLREMVQWYLSTQKCSLE